MTVMLLYNRLPKSSLAKPFTFPKSPLPKISSLPKSSLLPKSSPLHTPVLRRVPLRADQYLFDWANNREERKTYFWISFLRPTSERLAYPERVLAY